jgi:hypothetical protein
MPDSFEKMLEEEPFNTPNLEGTAVSSRIDFLRDKPPYHRVFAFSQDKWRSRRLLACLEINGWILVGGVSSALNGFILYSKIHIIETNLVSPVDRTNRSKMQFDYFVG